jgi:hypothetical protein
MPLVINNPPHRRLCCDFTQKALHIRGLAYIFNTTMAHTFTVPLKGRSPSELIRKAKNAAAQSEAVFAGDERNGSFSSTEVAGTYEISGDYALITVTKKPFIAPWSLVESKVRKFFA